MDTQIVTFKSASLFPPHFKFLGYLFFFMGLILVALTSFFAFIPLVLGALIITGYRGLQFNKANKDYRDYNSFLFLKFGKWKKYSHVEDLFINEATTSQKIYTRVNEGTTIRGQEYNAYLKFADGTKIHLMTKKNKEELKKRLSLIANFFQSQIADYTQA